MLVATILFSSHSFPSEPTLLLPYLSKIGIHCFEWKTAISCKKTFSILILITKLCGARWNLSVIAEGIWITINHIFANHEQRGIFGVDKLQLILIWTFDKSLSRITSCSVSGLSFTLLGKQTEKEENRWGCFSDAGPPWKVDVGLCIIGCRVYLDSNTTEYVLPPSSPCLQEQKIYWWTRMIWLLENFAISNERRTNHCCIGGFVADPLLRNPKN